MIEASAAHKLRRMLIETKMSDRQPATTPIMAIRVPVETVATTAASAKHPDAILHIIDRCLLVVSKRRITAANIGQPANMSGLVNPSKWYLAFSHSSPCAKTVNKHHGTKHCAADHDPKQVRKAARIAGYNNGKRSRQKPLWNHLRLEGWVVPNPYEWVQCPAKTDNNEEKEQEARFTDYAEAKIFAILKAGGSKRNPRRGDYKPVKIGVRRHHNRNTDWYKSRPEREHCQDNKPWQINHQFYVLPGKLLKKEYGGQAKPADGQSQQNKIAIGCLFHGLSGLSAPMILVLRLLSGIVC